VLWAAVAVLWGIGWVGARHAESLAPVTVVVDGVSRHLWTRAATVGQLLEDVGVAVSTDDQLVPDRTSAVEPRMTIVVRRARPVTVVADGRVERLRTLSDDVDSLLREAGVSLGPGDQLLINRVPAEWGVEPGFDPVPELSLSTGSPVVTSRGGRLRSGAISHLEVRRATALSVEDGGIDLRVYTLADRVGEALANAGVVLYVGDRVYPDPDTLVSPGLHVRIERAVPVYVQADGRTVRLFTQGNTVGDVLAELGVTLVGRDFCEPPIDAPVQTDVRIRVVRVSEETVIEQEDVPFETVWVPDAALELDHRRVDDVGANGILRRRYKVTLHDGDEVARELEEQWMAQEPRARQIAYGTKIVVRTLETPDGPIEYWRRIRVFLTAYTAATCGKTPDHPEYGITRLGWRMRHGIIAVDPRVIRLRSQLYVPGYGPGVAGDTGGLIRGRHIDLGYEEDGLVWHYEWGWVYVLTPVPPASQIPWILPDYPRENR